MKMLLAVKTDRMRELAAFLETVPPEDFDLAGWQTREAIDPVKFGPFVWRKGCGFAGCAMGWAAYSGKFPGLRIAEGKMLVYRGATSWKASQKFLGITEALARFLFEETRYDDATPSDVAIRLARCADIIDARIARLRSAPKHEPEVTRIRQQIA